MNDPIDPAPNERDDAAELIAFFERLPAATRRAYERLAARDADRGEDVSRESGAS